MVRVTANRVTERVVERIRSSDYWLKVVYPKAVTKPSGESVSSLPVSPLLAAPNPVAVIEEDPDRTQSDVTLQCLFLEVTAMGDAKQQRMAAAVGGWSLGTTALARVVAADADLVTGGTVFDGCAHVEVQGRRYKVVNVVRQAASTVVSGTYYVMLTGASKA